MLFMTGGNGLLGTELRKHLKNVIAPTEEEYNILNPPEKYDVDMVIHCAAYTDVVGAETKVKECFDVNVIGTYNLLKLYENIPFVYISTEYIYNPVNVYSYSKLVGEFMVKAYSKNYLIIRTLFKPNPFPYSKAFYDQYTTGDYIDMITPLMIDEINSWDKKPKIVDVGTERKTIYELARRTRNVQKCSVKNVKGVKLPEDYL